MATDNPLLGSRRIPPFPDIRVEHIEPAVAELLRRSDEALARLEGDVAPSWAGVVEGLERLNDDIGYTWGAIHHLLMVAQTDELRTAYEAVEPELVRFSVRLGQSRPIYDALVALRDGPGWAGLDEAQRRIVTTLIRRAKHSGVGLEGPARERFNAIQQELAELGTRFSNHVLDATKAWSMTLEDEAEVEGLPPSWRQMAAQAARAAGHPEATPERGPWRATLDVPSVLPILKHAQRRELREAVYRARVMRASSGDTDNTPVLKRILALRLEEARLLDYPDYAGLSLASKMAPGVEAVETLMEELRERAWPAAHREIDELAAFAGTRGFESELKPWDLTFWAERLREERYAYTDEELRPYFPLERVLDGLFGLTERLFGVTIRRADGEAPVWHPDVRFFTIESGAGRTVAHFFLDPYSRPAEKRGGAWHSDCVGRSALLAPAGGSARLPISYLVCNQTPPVGDQPSLMTFYEVETLFHEFGHGLHHMLTTVDYGLAAGGKNVEWDAIELPSTFMENWCFHTETLRGLGRHVETGEALPDTLIEKIQASRTFHAGLALLRQLFFTLTDLALHHGYDPERDDPFTVESRVAERTTVLPRLPEDRFLCAFDHIFGGGYAAGYYSYKWAEVLSADAFAAFEEVGLDDPEGLARVGRRFRDTILALGGSRHPMDVFKAFRGREPRTEPLLRQYGLAS